MFQQIIVPLDGSEEAACAIGPAAALAVRIGAPLHVVALFANEADRATLEGRVNEQLGSTGDVVRVVEVAPIKRSVAEDIHDLAARHAPSLVVMGSHGRGRSAAVLGSVTADIVRHRGQPVLVVGPSNVAGRFRTHGPAIVAVTGEDQTVLDTTAALLGETDFEPFVVHVMDPAAARELDLAHTGPGGSDFPMESVVAERGARALEESTDRTNVGFDVFHDKRPARTIVDQALSRRAGLIVMTSHARQGLDLISHGSVAADVIREAPCPVLVVGLED